MKYVEGQEFGRWRGKRAQDHDAGQGSQADTHAQTMFGPTARSSLFKTIGSHCQLIMPCCNSLPLCSTGSSFSSTGNNLLNLVETVYKPFELTDTIKGNGNGLNRV
jgi:hypothetical protein